MKYVTLEKHNKEILPSSGSTKHSF